MTIINIQEDSNPTKYLVITQQKDPETLITTRVLITDNANNRINVVDIGRGPPGVQGPVGPQGPPGESASFDVLPISSGGTNNTGFVSDKIIYFDGNKLLSTEYSIQDLITNTNSITGILEGSGIYKTTSNNTVTINTNVGDGLAINNDNVVIVDDTIARKSDIEFGNIDGVLPINKGGTNNSLFNVNRLVYYDGDKLTSFPLNTGNIVTSGSKISVIAGSGLSGGGELSIPSGSVVLKIDNSSDIIVSESSINLSVTGQPGTYSKVVTDSKGRVISGFPLSTSDIIDALGYTPWHSGNDGSGSMLDADLLDGKNSSYYLNFANLTGNIQTNLLPDVIIPSTFTKVTTNSKGIVIEGSDIDFTDVINALEYIPLSTSGGSIIGDLGVTGNFNVANGNVVLEDNLPFFSFNNNSILPSDPRGFSFEYGNVYKRTGLLAYFPVDQQLKLITNIVDDGSNDINGGDGDTNFSDEINGGDASSIFVLGSIEGEESIVLLEHIADQKYLSLTANQIVNGEKTFTEALRVSNYLEIIKKTNYNGPPLLIGSNTNLVYNLNSDLLDGQHGYFYRDAINLTGILLYSNVEVTNLSGSPTYIAKFNNLTDDPSRTIDSSIMSQPEDDLLKIENGSLSIGENLDTQNPSLVIGSGNSTSEPNTVSIGASNSASKENSMSIGSGAQTWISNQLSIGAFNETLDGNTIGRGQSSYGSIGYYGEPGSISYSDLKPKIEIPNNKTVLYDIDLVFSKFGSSGLAAISFTSGLIKNINGNTFILQSGLKQELFNNSQIREYLYTADIESQDINQAQILSVTDRPLKYNNEQIRNLNNVNLIKIDPSYMKGTFHKFFNGDIFLEMQEPVTEAIYTTSAFSRDITIKLYGHGCVEDCFINFVPISGTSLMPVSVPKQVQSVVNSNFFTVRDQPWSGTYNDCLIHIPNESVNYIDSLASLIFHGEYSSSNQLSNVSPIPSGRLFPGSKIKIISGNEIGTTGTINSITYSFVGYTITVDEDIFNLLDNNVSISTVDYSNAKLSNSDRIFFSTNEYNLSLNRTGIVEQTESGINIYVSGFTGPTIINNVSVYATIDSTGILNTTKKRNYSSTFEREKAQFNTYVIPYEQKLSVDNTGAIEFSWPLNDTNAPPSDSYLENYDPYIEFSSASNIFSGVFTSNSNIITNCTPIQVDKLSIGTVLYSDISGFPETGNAVVSLPTDDTVVLDVAFSGDNASGYVGYSGTIPNNQYEILNISETGLIVKRLYQLPDSGVYYTGSAVLYNNYGISDIKIDTIDLCNIASGTSGYLNFTTNSSGLFPINNTYRINENNDGEFTINNFHLMPDSGVRSTGYVQLNLNLDHGFLPPSKVNNLLQDIPIAFTIPEYYTVTSGLSVTDYGFGNVSLDYPALTEFDNQNRTPNSGLYTVLAVTGHTIKINDFNRNLVLDTNKNDLISIDTNLVGYCEHDNDVNLKILYEKNYFQENDSLFLSFNNGSQYDGYYRIVGIDSSYDNSGWLLVRPTTGNLMGLDANTVSYMGHCSGEVDRFYNLFYFNTVGGNRYENWNRDSDGLYTSAPKTGYFRISDAPSLCKSGTLCIQISGWLNDYIK